MTTSRSSGASITEDVVGGDAFVAVVVGFMLAVAVAMAMTVAMPVAVAMAMIVCHGRDGVSLWPVMVVRKSLVH